MVPFSHMEDRMAELKEILLNRFSSIESALKDAEETITREAQQAEQIAGANLAIGGFQYTSQACIVVPAGRRSLEHVAQRLFKRIVHTHLS